MRTTKEVTDKLRDLVIQATQERSHYYVKSVCLEAMDEIGMLKHRLMILEQENPITAKAMATPEFLKELRKLVKEENKLQIQAESEKK